MQWTRRKAPMVLLGLCVVGLVAYGYHLTAGELARPTPNPVPKGQVSPNGFTTAPPKTVYDQIQFRLRGSFENSIRDKEAKGDDWILRKSSVQFCKIVDSGDQIDVELEHGGEAGKFLRLRLKTDRIKRLQNGKCITFLRR
jgi:hypothetical protein